MDETIKYIIDHWAIISAGAAALLTGAWKIFKQYQEINMLKAQDNQDLAAKKVETDAKDQSNTEALIEVYKKAMTDLNNRHEESIDYIKKESSMKWEKSQLEMSKLKDSLNEWKRRYTKLDKEYTQLHSEYGVLNKKYTALELRFENYREHETN